MLAMSEIVPLVIWMMQRHAATHRVFQKIGIRDGACPVSVVSGWACAWIIRLPGETRQAASLLQGIHAADCRAERIPSIFFNSSDEKPRFFRAATLSSTC